MDQPEVYLTICVNNYSEDTRQKVGLGQTTRDRVGLKIKNSAIDLLMMSLFCAHLCHTSQIEQGDCNHSVMIMVCWWVVRQMNP